jgi:hypothetical protein
MIKTTSFSYKNSSLARELDSVELGFQIDPVYRPMTKAPMRAPPSVFETSNTGRVLQLVITFNLRSLDPFDLFDPDPVLSSLYIPIGTILQAVSRIHTSNLDDYILPWSEWGTGVRWIYERALQEYNNGTAIAVVSGSRGVFTQLNPRRAGCLSRWSECWHEPWWIASILEFHPKLCCANSLPNSSRQDGKSVMDPCVYQPSASTVALGQDRIDEWLDGADKSVLPYMSTPFKHRVLHGLSREAPDIWIDDEHSESEQC